jgi:hypothetical protein
LESKKHLKYTPGCNKSFQEYWKRRSASQRSTGNSHAEETKKPIHSATTVTKYKAQIRQYDYRVEATLLKQSHKIADTIRYKKNDVGNPQSGVKYPQ